MNFGITFGNRKETTGRHITKTGSTASPALRAALLLVLPLLLAWGVIGTVRPDIIHASVPGSAPGLTPPSNLQVVTLDSSFHVTFTPSTDPSTAWHVVTVWDGGMLEQSKVVSRTSRAAQTNGLVPGRTYTIKVQAMDAAGNLSQPISEVDTTDPQSPMGNAAFFENFNGPSSDLANYFDMRTSHGTNLQPESIGTDKLMIIPSENHFHTQLIGGKQRAEIYLRPRVPFDFAGRTGTFQFEVDTAAVQHSEGKWFEIHLMRTIPWSGEEFGAGNGEQLIDSLEFSVRSGDGPTEANVNIPQITVNIGGNVQRFVGTARQLTPANIRMPVVIRVSQGTAEMFINGVSVVRASGYTLPFTRGYWALAHRGWYGSRDMVTTPQIVQLIHWETVQFDGPTGSYNPLVRTYIQPGCSGIVHNEHNGIEGCDRISLLPEQPSSTMTFNVLEDSTTARSIKLFYNGTADSGSMAVSLNGHPFNVATASCCFQDTLNYADVPASWLRDGANTLSFSMTGGGGAEISQIEVEVVYDQHRVMAVPQPAMNMPMLGITATNFRVDHISTDPMVYTTTTNLYNLGSTEFANYTASVISTESPWLTVSPASGSIRAAGLGGGVVPLTLSVNFNGLTTDSDGQVGVIKISGGGMPIYVAVLAVNDGSNTRPPFITTYTGANTTFNKNAIPDYHGPGNATPTPAGTVVPLPTPCGAGFSDVPTNYWAYTYINYMACGGFVSGYADGTFRPGNVTTRGQIAKIIVLGEGWPIDTTGGPHFSDVATNNPFYAYIETAANRSIISGYSDGTFRPYNNVTRAQLSKIIVSAEGWPIDTTGGPHFSDVATNNPFYTYIETATNRNIISGYSDGTFRYGNNATRAQLSKIFYLALTGALRR